MGAGWQSEIAFLYQRALAETHLRGSAAVADADHADLESLCLGWIQPATFRFNIPMSQPASKQHPSTQTLLPSSQTFSRSKTPFPQYWQPSSAATMTPVSSLCLSPPISPNISNRNSRSRT